MQDFMSKDITIDAKVLATLRTSIAGRDRCARSSGLFWGGRLLRACRWWGEGGLASETMCGLCSSIFVTVHQYGTSLMMGEERLTVSRGPQASSLVGISDDMTVPNGLRGLKSTHTWDTQLVMNTPLTYTGSSCILLLSVSHG